MDDYISFTEDVLRQQDGKEVPLTDKPGGQVIGTATMHYDEKTGELRARMQLDDPDVWKFLNLSAEAVIFKKGNN